MRHVIGTDTFYFTLTNHYIWFNPFSVFHSGACLLAMDNLTSLQIMSFDGKSQVYAGTVNIPAHFQSFSYFLWNFFAGSENGTVYMWAATSLRTGGVVIWQCAITFYDLLKSFPFPFPFRGFFSSQERPLFSIKTPFSRIQSIIIPNAVYDFLFLIISQNVLFSRWCFFPYFLSSQIYCFGKDTLDVYEYTIQVECVAFHVFFCW